MRKGVIIFVSSIIFIYCQSVSAQNVVDSLGTDSLIRQLPEVMIKGEHPLAVVHESAITYDLPRIIEKKGVDKFDVIIEVRNLQRS